MSKTSSQRPNIVWIGVDQLRYDTLGCNGNALCKTPNVDRIASQGICFDRAYCPTTLCTPARASMFTGQYAFHHGMLTNCEFYHTIAPELPDPGMLLHPRLARLGYGLGFAGKWHVGTEKGPVDYGFEGMNIAGYGNILQDPDYKRYLEEANLTYEIRDPIYANPGENCLLGATWDGPVESTPTHYLAGRAIGMMEDLAQRDQPFLLTCQFWGPHQPYRPSREYAGLHDRSAIEPWVNFGDTLRDKPATNSRTTTDFYRALPKEWEGWREIVGLYYDYTTMIDAEIGRLIERLDTLGIAENTLIIFTSDHGDMTGSHGGMNDKGYMFEEVHRVPLILSWPGQFDAGKRSDALVYNMDIFPTILDLLGIADKDLDGQSLCPLARGASESRDDLLLEFHGIRFLQSQRGLVTRDGWKYVFTPSDRDECYDLNQDPGELVNLIDDPRHNDKVEELRNRMMEAAIAAGDPLAACICKFFGHWINPSGRPDPSQR